MGLAQCRERSRADPDRHWNPTLGGRCCGRCDWARVGPCEPAANDACAERHLISSASCWPLGRPLERELRMSLRHLFAVTLATLFFSLGCTPRLAGDGSYGCGAGACPAGTFCHAILRCYSTPESDAGPRRDAYSEGIAAYEPCTSACTDGTACDRGPGATLGGPGRVCYRLCSDCPASIGRCDMMRRYCIPNAW